MTSGVLIRSGCGRHCYNFVVTGSLVRALDLRDIQQAMELSTAAGWNQTEQDWRRLIELQPDGCFAIEENGCVVATTTILFYGRDLAWIGMVLTHKDHQRRGLARKLMETALETARARGVRCVKLDATDQGEPLYRSLGFQVEQQVERWRREPAPLEQLDFYGIIDPHDHGLDRKAFGADRQVFLNSLFGTGNSVGSSDGYAITRPGTRARYFGPCVARDAGLAELLARVVIAPHAGEPWFWDLLPKNPHVKGMADGLGFRRVRELQRMFWGENVRGDDSLVFAIAGFEAG